MPYAHCKPSPRARTVPRHFELPAGYRVARRAQLVPLPPEGPRPVVVVPALVALLPVVALASGLTASGWTSRAAAHHLRRCCVRAMTAAVAPCVPRCSLATSTAPMACANPTLRGRCHRTRHRHRRTRPRHRPTCHTRPRPPPALALWPARTCRAWARWRVGGRLAHAPAATLIAPTARGRARRRWWTGRTQGTCATVTSRHRCA